MEEIKIIFFVLGTFLGSENRIAADKTTITIHPETKTILIQQESLFSLIRTREDSSAASRQLSEISRNDAVWRPKLKSYRVKTCELYNDVTGNLNAKIFLKYSKTEDLKDYGLSFNPEGYFSFISFPEDNLRTNDGRLNGNYWHFDADKPFTFTLEPFIGMPEAKKAHKKFLKAIR